VEKRWRGRASFRRLPIAPREPGQPAPLAKAELRLRECVPGPVRPTLSPLQYLNCLGRAKHGANLSLRHQSAAERITALLARVEEDCERDQSHGEQHCDCGDHCPVWNPHPRAHWGQISPPPRFRKHSRIPRFVISAVALRPFATRATRHPAQIPQEVAVTSRRCPPIPAHELRKAPLWVAIPADPRSLRNDQDRPVTPEVAGSSPVAPAKVPGNRRILLPDMTNFDRRPPDRSRADPACGSRAEPDPGKSAGNQLDSVTGLGNRRPSIIRVIPRRSRERNGRFDHIDPEAPVRTALQAPGHGGCQQDADCMHSRIRSSRGRSRGNSEGTSTASTRQHDAAPTSPPVTGSRTSHLSPAGERANRACTGRSRGPREVRREATA
jgi:hypothetical protein